MTQKTALGQAFEERMRASVDTASPGMQTVARMIYGNKPKADSGAAHAVDRVHFRRMGVAVECDEWDNRRRS